MFYARPGIYIDNGAITPMPEWCGLKQARRRDLGVSVRPRWPLAELPGCVKLLGQESNFRHRPSLKQHHGHPQ
ncbi:hypothetical protein ACVXG9_28795 [Escherichia coli]